MSRVKGTVRIKSFVRRHRYTLIALLAVLIFLFYPAVGIYDWEKEIMYCRVIRQAMVEDGVFPFFLWNSGKFDFYPAIQQSAAFAANPETLLFSPFILLLYILPPVLFLKVFVLINFLAGWAGLLLLAKNLEWSDSQTRIVSALFFLSPIVFQHLSIGYMPWVNLYLLPWLFYFAEGERFLKKALGMGAVQALMLLQGGLHPFVWSVSLLGFWGVFRSMVQKKIQPLAAVAASGIVLALLALPRLVLSMQTFSGFEQRFFAGYSPRGFFRWAFIPPLFNPPTMDDIEMFIEIYIDGVPYWDGNQFWGFALVLVFLLPVFFIWTARSDRGREDTTASRKALPLFLASLVLLVLSFGGIYENVITAAADLVRLPALKGMEKYPFRFAIPAYFGFAYTIALVWPRIPVFFSAKISKVTEFMKRLVGSIGIFYGKLLARTRLPSAVTMFFVVATALAVVLRGPLLSWVNTEIELAYGGGGMPVLRRLMMNAAQIPVDAYIQKAASLYGMIVITLLVVTVALMLLWLIARWPDHGSKKTAKDRGVNPATIKLIMEALLVLPILFAFSMWWRVSLATPVEKVASFAFDPPEAEWVSTDSDMDIPDMTVSANSLEFTAADEMSDGVVRFGKIPFTDSRFLTVESQNAEFIDSSSALGVKINAPGRIALSAGYTGFSWLMGVWGISWAVSFYLLVKKSDWSQHSS